MRVKIPEEVTVVLSWIEYSLIKDALEEHTRRFATETSQYATEVNSLNRQFRDLDPRKTS